LETSPISN